MSDEARPQNQLEARFGISAMRALKDHIKNRHLRFYRSGNDAQFAKNGQDAYVATLIPLSEKMGQMPSRLQPGCIPAGFSVSTIGRFLTGSISYFASYEPTNSGLDSICTTRTKIQVDAIPNAWIKTSLFCSAPPIDSQQKKYPLNLSFGFVTWYKKRAAHDSDAFLVGTNEANNALQDVPPPLCSATQDFQDFIAQVLRIVV